MSRYAMKKFLGVFCGALCLSGCPAGGYEYERWAKKGASIVDLKKAVLSCGQSRPESRTPPPDGSKQFADWQIDRCMEEKLGYRSRGIRPAFQEICKKENSPWPPDSPWCSPAADVPEPSAERRLGSYYCRRMRRWHAVDKEERKGQHSRLRDGRAYECREIYKDEAPTWMKLKGFEGCTSSAYYMPWGSYDPDPIEKAMTGPKRYFGLWGPRTVNISTKDERLYCRKIREKEPGRETCYVYQLYPFSEMGPECLF